MKKLILAFLFIFSLALLISCGECTHEWTEATCTEPKTCSLCGITEGEPTNHALGDWVVTAPSCEHDGSKTRSCVCGKESETEEIKALGHDITKHYGKKPTCTENGYSEYETCSRCAYTTYKELPAAHSYKVTVVAPSCTAGGYTSYVCEKCEHSYKDSETDKLAHSFSEWTTVAASCTVDGSKTRSCACGETETELLTKLGHELVDVAAVASTCKSTGHNAHKACTRCDYKEGYEEIQKSDHSYTFTVKPYTCTEEGYTTYICSSCGFRYVADRTAPAHRFGEWQITPASCEQSGSKNRSCTCGKTETETIPATGHSYGDWVTVEPKCEEAGSRSKSCACGDTVTEPIPATGHSYGDWVTVEPKCEEDGSRSKSCACGDTVTEPIPATGHSYGDWVTVSEPKCEEEGLQSKSCACGDTVTEPIPATGHNIIHHDGVENTCTESGYKDYDTCSNCDYNTYEVLPAMHKYTSIVTTPTCTEQGFTTHTCSECNDSYVDSYIPAVGHSWGAWYVSKEITPTDSVGEKKRDCLSCDEKESKALDVSYSGTMTETSTMQYKIYEDGTLMLIGSGETPKTGWEGGNQPYLNQRSLITRIVIGEGITKITSGELSNLHNVREILFPTTITALGNNAFMDTVHKDIKTFTVPASINSIGDFSIGYYRRQGTVFTDVIFENPNTVFPVDKNGNLLLTAINGGINRTALTLYSYGAENNVSRYAAAIGATYIDLNTMAEGTVGNVSYTLFNGELILSVIDSSLPATLPEAQPWLENVDKSTITTLVIKDGFTDIPAEYFADYTALASVTLADSVVSVGNMAFATSTANSTQLSINFPSAISAIGVNVFKNRTAVCLKGFTGSATESFEEDGVTVQLTKVFKLLLIGNSLSQDASDNSGAGTASQLYNIIKAMLGDDSYVEIGILYSGAKTAAWHATMAYNDESKYSFYLISDKTGGKWQNAGSASAKIGLSYTDWDHVTIQPYSIETKTGIAAPSKEEGDTYGAECDAQFLPLSSSLPYLLDYINTYAPTAEAHYYLIWQSTDKYNTLNIGASNYATMLNVAKTASKHTGTNSGKAFASLIPAGTAIQIARTTYFGLLGYDVDSTTKEDTQKGLQRDNPHLTYCVGRYIVALLFAEVLVPESHRAENYTIPDIKDSPLIGKLPKAYTTLAQLIVAETLKTMDKTGDAQYAATTLSGYETDPADKLKTALSSYDFSNITASDKTALEAKIAEIAKGLGEADTVVTVTVNENITPTSTAQAFSATVTVRFGYTTREVTVNGSVKLP